MAEWDLKPIPPRAARLAGGISLGCWLLVVIFGRVTDFSHHAAAIALGGHRCCPLVGLKTPICIPPFAAAAI